MDIDDVQFCCQSESKNGSKNNLFGNVYNVIHRYVYIIHIFR